MTVDTITRTSRPAVEASDPKKPYGDVTYADPGYQRDRKARYPLDTEEHIRHAWDYINQADNAAKYTPKQLKIVKGRIRAAMKRIGAQVSESARPATAAHDRVVGRVLEAKGADESGGRVFRVRIIDAGDSKNGRRYPHPVLAAAVPLYEGAKAYDHHRTPEELRTSTITGLVGSYRDVTAVPEGLDGDLHLLPSAAHTGEALDASLAAQAAGLAPLVGISHDVLAHYQPLAIGGRRLHEATAIVKVHSADVVADPAAGDKPIRMLAGGDDEGGDLDDVDAGAGDDAAPVLHDRSTARGRAVVAAEATARGLAAGTVEHVLAALPTRFSEAQLTAAINAIYDGIAHAERTGLRPSLTAEVVGEERQKKVKALDAFFAGTEGGYRSLREAYLDFTGWRGGFLGEDLNRRILADSFGTGFDSAQRSTESMISTSWNLALGDSVTRVMIQSYAAVPGWQDWKRFTTQAYGLDFRTQRRDRVGGYGILPAVNQSAPYQPLTSPTNEEATYAISKRGGTEDVTLEMIANDDVQAISRIPDRLGRSAAYTLYRFVFDIFPANANTSYDATALFAAGHANTDANALSQSALSTGRRKMRKQAAYGDASDILSTVPRFLVVPSDLEELGWQLVTSLVAVPATPAGPSDTPNLHHNMELVVVDYYSSATGWYLVADPAMCPTIEIGFYAPNANPELFTQSDQSVGSMFNADTFTWKLRHIYSGTVIDHRALYRGNS